MEIKEVGEIELDERYSRSEIWKESASEYYPLINLMEGNPNFYLQLLTLGHDNNCWMYFQKNFLGYWISIDSTNNNSTAKRSVYTVIWI